MFKRRYLFILLSLLLLLAFVACSSDDEASSNDPDTSDVDETGDDDADEIDKTPITYSLFNAGVSRRDIDTNETRIGKIFEEETGVNFKIEHLVGDIDTKIGVMVASGSYPDVIVPDSAIDVLLDAEAFIPLNDLLEEHGPNLLEAYGDYLDLFTMDDGNIYYIPFGATINEYKPNPNIDQGAFWIQRGILKEYGFPEINTLDEYFDVIERYAAENPEIDGMTTIPFTGLTYDWRFFAFSNIPNHLAGYPNDGGVMIDMETHEASVYADSEYAKDFLWKMNEIYHKGLLDRELFVANYDEYISKLSSGRVLGFFDYGWQFGDARNALRDAGNPDREFMALPVVFEGVEYDQYLDPPSFTANRGIGISRDAESPERIIQYWDNMIKEENQKLIMWGFEGEHYSVDDDGLFYRTQEQLDLTRNQDEREEVGMTHFEWYWPRLNGTFSDGINAVEPARQPEVALADYNDDDREYLDAYGINMFSELFAPPDDRPWYPAWGANIEQGSPEQIFEERQDELLKRHYPRIVLADDEEEFEEEWEAFVEAYRSLDVDGYEAFFEEYVQSRLED
ncbi:extracellular solute-binding protein [Evansella cellulosilytica]|uniref:Extracellular solute-binding protein n=1 Tax=Evansella cellulosilytica (strain ATCC 21833 / DSM 2522 / FERM P-1141 / JCM 9156 / N-4) TaxID=649639 RepID=E6TXL2_EVAC2|nr:extracellular solute-binding protein [Evansella cellulosilytica]ADU28826.1 hypothetical protein Bcell_0544 [Evansella cellulosilytica DSM 2522]